MIPAKGVHVYCVISNHLFTSIKYTRVYRLLRKWKYQKWHTTLLKELGGWCLWYKPLLEHVHLIVINCIYLQYMYVVVYVLTRLSQYPFRACMSVAHHSPAHTCWVLMECAHFYIGSILHWPFQTCNYILLYVAVICTYKRTSKHHMCMRLY